MKNPFYLTLLFVVLVLFACEQKKDTPAATNIESNPPAEGFDAENSDAKAIAIADEVMEAMGGRAAYDSTRYLSWNFLEAESIGGIKKLVMCASNLSVKILKRE